MPPEDKARLQAIRDHFQTARPSLDELVASGDAFPEPMQHGVTLDAMHIASLLKHARRPTLVWQTLRRTAASTVPRLARLENGLYENTIITLHLSETLRETLPCRNLWTSVDRGT